MKLLTAKEYLKRADKKRDSQDYHGAMADYQTAMADYRTAIADYQTAMAVY